MALSSWLSSSLVRHFPSTPPQKAGPRSIEAALNEKFSFQVAVHNPEHQPTPVQITVTGPQGWALRVRRVGYVPVRHRDSPLTLGELDSESGGPIPGFVPDPLFDENSLLMGGVETHSFWISVQPNADAQPGSYLIQVVVTSAADEPVIHPVQVRLHNLTILPRRDFPITQWFYVDALIDWYKTDLFDERLWTLLERYIRNLVEHGQDTLYVPVFTPPLDGVKRPTQLLSVERIGANQYTFDWRDVRRFIRLARSQGIRYFEWCHFFTQWGAAHPLRIYEGQGRDEKLLWDADIPAISIVYRRFLEQFLPELKYFLDEEHIFESSFFHVSDEPHGAEHLAQYRQDRALLRELAPWMKVMDALSDIEYARQGLTDIPIPRISVALDFLAAGLPSWCYYCVGPRGLSLNRMVDTPLPKLAMHGFLFYRWPFQGFLHWGFNYWYQELTRNLIDPYTVLDSLYWEKGWVFGDSFMVYPGPDGPVDSLRWEVIAESLQDYALLQTLKIDRNDPLLSEIASFSDFPKTEVWRQSVKRRLLATAGQR